MAKVDIPQEDNSPKKKPDTAAKQRKQASYQESLSYERAFLKKKEELSHSSSIKQLQQDIAAIQQRADIEIATARELISDKAELEAQLSSIRMRLANDLAKKQLDLVAQQRENDYAAHQFATACTMRLFQTQNVHQRAQTAAALADAQSVQTQKLRAIKEAEIADLQAQKKSATSEEEKKRIASQIRGLRKDIASAEAEEARYQQQAAHWAEIVRRAEFDRLSAADKLASKEKEIVDLQSAADSAVAEIDSHIEAKKIDLAAAEESGKDKRADQLRQEIAALQADKAATAENYQSQIAAIRTSIEAEGGYREQAQKAAATPVAPVPPPSSTSADSVDVPTEDTAENATDLSIQVGLILNALVEFVSSFQTYVDTLDSKLNTPVIPPNMLAMLYQPNDPNKISSEGVVTYLRELVDSSTTGDVELRSQLNSRIDQLSNVLHDNQDLDLTVLTDALTRMDNTQAFEELNNTLAAMLEDSEDSKEDKKKGKRVDDPTARAKQSLKQELADIQERKQDGVDRAALQKERMKAFFDNPAYRNDKIKEAAVEKLQEGLAALENICRKIDSNMAEFFQYQAEINAKLQGTDLDYEDAISTLTKNLGMSMLVNQKDYINKFKELVDAGIAHNMETRAFLATVSDKVVNTFNVFDANLLKLIRIQQNDSTAARLGLESTLNKFFNSYFSDSSYLSDGGPHDAISGAILEASSMLSKEMSLEFEYAVHKWLGAMYSLGVSDDTLQAIAQGLNYLGTGNVSALSSNDSLQTLLAMSSIRGGVSYADMLTTGLDGQTTNKLLSGMITYLMEIANNTDNNQVVKSAYSDLFGLHMSDLRAIINMTNEDITTLSSLKTTYSAMESETDSQLSSIVSRTAVGTMIDTLFENAVLGASLDIGKNPVSYGLWKTLNIVEGLTGGIALPFINVFGSGFDLNTTVTQLAKGGMAGLAMLGNLVSALGSGGDARGMSLDAWNNVTPTARGTANKFLSSGTQSGMSSSTRLDYAGSGSSDDIKRTEMSDASDSADEDSEVTNKHSQDEQDIPKLIHEEVQKINSSLANEDVTLIEVQSDIYSLLRTRFIDLSSLLNIPSLLAPGRVFMTSGGGDNAIGGNYSVSNNGVLAMSTSSLQEYNDQLNKVTKVTDVFQNKLQNINISNASIDIWSMLNNMLSSNQSATKYVQTLYADDKTGIPDFNDYKSLKSSDDVKILETLATTVASDIQLRSTLKEVVQMQTMNKVVFPEYVRATVDDLSPVVKKFIEQLTREAVEGMINGTFEDPEQSSGIFGVNDVEITHPIIKQLKALFDDNSTVVQTRDYPF